MATAPEREKPAPIPEGVEERPESVEIPLHIEREGVTPSTTQVTAQVTDDLGQPLIQTPTKPTIAIQVPADQAQLEDWSHGEPANSLTWYALFWLRIIKKALRYGWRVIRRGAQ